MNHPLCGCAECRTEVLEMVKLVDRRQHHRDGEIESLIDVTMRVLREHETSKDTKRPKKRH